MNETAPASPRVNPPSLQDVFDRVVNHLRTQDSPAYSNNESMTARPSSIGWSSKRLLA